MIDKNTEASGPLRTITDDQIVTERKVPRRSFLSRTGALLAGAAGVVSALQASGLRSARQNDPDKPPPPDREKRPDDPDKRPADPDKRPADPDKRPADPDKRPADPDKRPEGDRTKPADPDKPPPTRF